MFTYFASRLRTDSRTTRHSQAQKPRLESLEGRQLLSTLTAVSGVTTVPASLSHTVAPFSKIGGPWLRWF